VSTQASNVYDEGKITEARRELSGALAGAAETIQETVSDAVQPVVETYHEVLVENPSVKVFAFGVLLGWALCFISQVTR